MEGRRETNSPSWRQTRAQSRRVCRQTAGQRPSRTKARKLILCHERNNLDGIRLVAALFVIYSHAFALSGHAEPTFCGEKIGTIGVKIFFVISGYLVTKSWVQDPNVPRYLARRTLRLLPALAVVVAACALVLGPVATTLSQSNYWHSSQFGAFWLNTLLVPQFPLPGVFEHNPFPNVVNGSLWTLPVEFFMYLTVPFFICLFGIRRAKYLCAGLALLLSASSIYLVRIAALDGHPQPDLVAFPANVEPYFAFGALIFLLRLERFCKLPVALIGLALCAVAGVGAIQSEVLLMIVLPCAVIAFAFSAPPYLGGAAKFGDLSYGLYLYAFPVQQALQYATDNSLEPAANFATAAAISALLAWLSWHCVEKYALRLKPRRRTPVPTTVTS